VAVGVIAVPGDPLGVGTCAIGDGADSAQLPNTRQRGAQKIVVGSGLLNNWRISTNPTSEQVCKHLLGDRAHPPADTRVYWQADRLIFRCRDRPL
jgi:hypothetical protein